MSNAFARPLLSVVVPVYNTERYLEQCLRSLADQDDDRYEVIIVNDGATDGSPRIAELFCESHSRFRLVSKANGGVSSARNRGIAEARGRYISFVDSDDYVEGRYVGTILDAAVKTAPDIIVFGGRTFPQDKIADAKMSPVPIRYIDNSVTAVLGERASRPFVHNKAYRRELLCENGVRFDEEMSLGEDQLFQFCIFPYARRISYISDVLYHYRCERKDSAMQRLSHEADEVLRHHCQMVSKILLWYRERFSQADVDAVANWGVDYLSTYFDAASYNVATVCAEAFLSLLEAIGPVCLNRESLRRLSSIRHLAESACSEPLVSVVMPMYNAERHLGQCLGSLQKQTMKRFEVIVVDDGSTDNSCEVVEALARSDGRFTLLHQEHGFAGRARNMGMARARGKYLLFLDSDDFFSPDLLEHAFARAEAYDADICLFSADSFDHQTGEIGAMPWVCRYELLPDAPVFSRRAFSENLYCITTPVPWNKLFKKSFVVEEGLQFQETRSANDMLFTLTALALADRITVLQESLVTYRINEGTSLQSTQDKDPFAFYQALCALQQSLRDHGLYADLQRPFVNFALDCCIHNIRTMKTMEAYRKVYDFVKQEGLTQLDIADKDDSWFYVYRNRNAERKHAMTSLGPDEYKAKFGD